MITPGCMANASFSVDSLCRRGDICTSDVLPAMSRCSFRACAMVGCVSCRGASTFTSLRFTTRGSVFRTFSAWVLSLSVAFGRAWCRWYGGLTAMQLITVNQNAKPSFKRASIFLLIFAAKLESQTNKKSNKCYRKCKIPSFR